MQRIMEIVEDVCSKYPEVFDRPAVQTFTVIEMRTVAALRDEDQCVVLEVAA